MSRPTPARTLVALVTGCLMVSTGCLSKAHYIPKDELIALAQQDPSTRGEHVRVVQGFMGSGGRRVQQEHSNVIVVDNSLHGHGHGHGHGRSSGVSHSGSRPKNAAKANVDEAKVLLVIAAAAVVGLALTEGVRYDGWVKVKPEHPVHLIGPGGQYTYVALADLDAETAAWAQEAYVRNDEGHLSLLERAPLNRRGATFGMTLGSAEISGTDGMQRGFMSHVQVGGFPTQQVGILLDLGVGWRDEHTADTVYEMRTAAELQVYPVAAGKLHAGFFGQLGGAARSDDAAGADDHSSLLGAGALVQLELTTRLALTGRAGITRVFGETVSDIGVGLSIY